MRKVFVENLPHNWKQNKRMNKNKQTFVAKIMQQYHYTFHSYPFDEILRSMNKTGKIS